MALDLTALLGEEASLLFAREWQLRDRVAASHGWEQQRIGSLCRLAAGEAPVLVATVDGLMQRTLPPDALRGAVTDISLGDRFDLNALSKKLVESGYTRAETVEGVGQFALRGGILDIYSPLSAPVRVEFFDDEVDAMGEFDRDDPAPHAERQDRSPSCPRPRCCPRSRTADAKKCSSASGRAAQKIEKKAADSPIVKTLRGDIERLANDLPLGGMDRYLAACYPDEVCALDYLSPDTLAAVSDGMRVLERGKNYHWELSEDVKPLIEEGVLCGEFASLALSQEALSHRMRALPRAAARRAADLARSARAARAAQHERALAAELRRQPRDRRGRYGAVSWRRLRRARSLRQRNAREEFPAPFGRARTSARSST